MMRQTYPRYSFHKSIQEIPSELPCGNHNQCAEDKRHAGINPSPFWFPPYESASHNDAERLLLTSIICEHNRKREREREREKTEQTGVPQQFVCFPLTKN